MARASSVLIYKVRLVKTGNNNRRGSILKEQSQVFKPVTERSEHEHTKNIWHRETASEHTKKIWRNATSRFKMVSKLKSCNSKDEMPKPRFKSWMHDT